jgi:hypothetical protein
LTQARAQGGGIRDDSGASFVVSQPWEDVMSRHLADHRKATTGSRVKHFLRLARTPRETWQRPRGSAGAGRLIQFLRIERGRTT